ncbi:helix-turn-helix domain-containing protein [Halorubrum sp. Eb13]|uniref:helix-turn-helix domain-containing protein n=1 Tax=Halorubrum sp. Eb13 TaxID=1383843 RepID=UPI0020CE2BCB|nr:helix-turn-helix domain-containing protein [Halorubrum sp. Eb13]
MISILRIEFQTSLSGVVGEITDRVPAARSITFENAFYADDGDWIESLLVTSESSFDPESVLTDLSRVELFHHEQVVGDSNEPTYRLTVVAHEPYPFLLGVILRESAIPNRLELRNGYFRGVVTVNEWESFRALADRIQDRFGRFELLSVNQVETTGEPLGSGQLGRALRNELSPEQVTVLRTAHRMGYFDVPRRVSADDIASELDIAQSTLSERLRLAEKRLFDLVFSAAGDSSSDGAPGE